MARETEDSVLTLGGTEAGGGWQCMYLCSISLARHFSPTLSALRVETMSCHVRGDSCFSLSLRISRN